ncbi:hypothetical protein D3273_24710 [Lichenibacterium minor]|uniref:Uncharacterized protein n=1 Tax=Lichenibacterium minor TaxID=2316528 RepID=A0A4Q2U3K3_9HYPH|nr:hypothetical protein [Lichenibacterium minor]RYC29315.1 hypothetical protein D3273_24710 [Lichenibacterium minor]
MRHREAAPRRTTIDINLIPSPIRTTARAPARDAAATITASLARVGRDVAAIGEQQATIRDGLARLRPIVEARKAMRIADAAYAARVERCTPASVQAANAARWGRSGARG